MKMWQNVFEVLLSGNEEEELDEIRIIREDDQINKNMGKSANEIKLSITKINVNRDVNTRKSKNRTVRTI